MNYKLVSEWPKTLPGDKGLPSSAWNYWQVSSVAVAADGNILVLHRGDHPILEYRPDGAFIGPWGDVTFSEGKVAAISKTDRTAAMSGYQATYGFGGCSNCGAHEIRVDPEGNVAPVPYPYGAPYVPGVAPYGAAPYVPAPGYVPNYGYIPR